jgi:DNA-binding CsgD family transcriptional regulator
MRRGRPRHDDILTPREWQVLRLIREGLTNEQIAEELGISLSAAKYHVSEILAKLGVPGRHEAVERAGELKHGRWAFTPPAWPARLEATKPLVWVVATASVSAVLLALLLTGASRSGRDVTSLSASQVGVDAAPEWLEEYERARLTTSYPHTVLLTAAPPAGLSPEDTALVESLPRVRTLRQLRDVLTDDINLIVIDRSAASEVEGTGFLLSQLAAGRAVVEINVCFDEVHYRGPYPPEATSGGEVTEIAPDGTLRRTIVTPNARPSSTCTLPLAGGEVPFFAFRRLQTPLEREASLLLGRGQSNESLVNLNLATGVLRVVVARLDAAAEGNVLPSTCDEGRLTGLEHLVCPE